MKKTDQNTAWRFYLIGHVYNTDSISLILESLRNKILHHTSESLSSHREKEGLSHQLIQQPVIAILFICFCFYFFVFLGMFVLEFLG